MHKHLSCSSTPAAGVGWLYFFIPLKSIFLHVCVSARRAWLLPGNLLRQTSTAAPVYLHCGQREGSTHLPRCSSMGTPVQEDGWPGHVFPAFSKHPSACWRGGWMGLDRLNLPLCSSMALLPSAFPSHFQLFLPDGWERAGRDLLPPSQGIWNPKRCWMWGCQVTQCPGTAGRGALGSCWWGQRGQRRWLVVSGKERDFCWCWKSLCRWGGGGGCPAALGHSWDPVGEALGQPGP